MSEKRAPGGLIALTVAEAKVILSWGEFVMESMGEIDGPEEDLYLRIREWRRRHTPEDAA